METRKPKKRLSDALGIGETLETFRPGPFPLTEEVLRHFYFHLWSLGRPDAQLAARSTADSLLGLWAPSYLPLMVRKNLIKKLHRLHDLFRAVVDSLRRKRKNAEEKKELFLKELKTRFDVSAESALDIIKADKTLSAEEKEEDQSFLLAIRDNRPHSLGPLDVKRIKRFERAAERERIAAAKAEKERKRQEVITLVKTYINI